MAINQRSSDIYAILLSAAAADPDAAERLSNYTKLRDIGQGLITAALARAGALRRGLGERDAADMIHELMSPELYRLFVLDRDWTAECFEHWLAGVLTQQLLRVGGSSR